MQHRPFVIAHRGISGRYPENTLISFEKAVEARVDFIEFDVQSTADSQLIVAHDNGADRCTDGQGLFKLMTLEQIKKLDAGSWFDAEFAGTRIPTLDEALDAIGDGRVRLCIEIKGATTSDNMRAGWDAVNIIRQRKIQQYVVISSYNPEALQAIREWDPLIATSLDPTPQDGSATPWELCQQVLSHKITAMMHDYSKITPELLDEAHQHGFSLWAWTVDKPDEMRQMVELGVDAIMSNHADVLRKVVDEMAPAASS